jgi:NADH-quinone oxidoreductase subunit C
VHTDRAQGIVERLGDELLLTESGGDEWGRPVLEIPPRLWRRAHEVAREEGYGFFDWLAGVDEGELEEVGAAYRVVTHLWCLSERSGVLLRTLIPAENAEVESLVEVFPGAGWHEREAYEMFGVRFAGHPDLKKLLLADEFEGHPLRKSFVLASRAVRPWPGAVEPGEGADGPEGMAERESERAGRRIAPRKKLLPPGVPQPGEWGPR